MSNKQAQINGTALEDNICLLVACGNGRHHLEYENQFFFILYQRRIFLMGYGLSANTFLFFNPVSCTQVGWWPEGWNIRTMTSRIH